MNLSLLHASKRFMEVYLHVSVCCNIMDFILNMLLNKSLARINVWVNYLGYISAEMKAWYVLKFRKPNV